MTPVAKIIVVDDSEIVRDTVQAILEDAGYAVIALGSPFELASAMTREKPDLALLDVAMPALTGDKLVRFIRRGGWACPLVLFSDRPEADLARLASECGAAGYICKSAVQRGLAERVATFLPDAR